MNRLLLAFQFLTIVPVRVRGEISDREMAGSVIFFPVAGSLQGVMCFLSAALLLQFFSTDITSCLVLVILIISNGGFHLDGLADSFDAMAVKATGDEKSDRERRLSAMKDSSTGAIGVTAIVISVLLKYLLLKNLFLSSSATTLYSLLFLMPVFSKWIMVPAMYHGTTARKDGLGRMFINSVTYRDVIVSSAITVIFCLVIAGALKNTIPASLTVSLFFILFATLYLFCLFAVSCFKKRFGGLTGDTFGAIHEISEILYLMVASLWLQRSI